MNYGAYVVISLILQQHKILSEKYYYLGNAQGQMIVQGYHLSLFCPLVFMTSLFIGTFAQLQVGAPLGMYYFFFSSLFIDFMSCDFYICICVYLGKIQTEESWLLFFSYMSKGLSIKASTIARMSNKQPVSI